jgi:hypothetical protein
MPATTRSSKSIVSVKRSVPLPSRNNAKWTKTEERDLIRMCRHTDLRPDQMADTLNRTEEAVRWRLAKIYHEHLDGRTDKDAIADVSNWLLPN